MRLLGTVLLVATGCGSDAGERGPRCALVGEPIVLPSTTNYDVAAASDGWVVVLSDGEGMGAVHIAADGTLGAREQVSLPFGSSFDVVSSNGVVYASSAAQATFDGVRIAERVDGAWTTAVEPGVEGNQTFTQGSAIAARGDALAIVWVAGAGLDGELKLYVTDYDASGFHGTAEVPNGGIPTIVGNEVEAAFAADGTLWVVVGGDQTKLALYAYARSPSGTWSEAKALGTVEGSYANISVAGMGFDGTSVSAVVVEPASFEEDSDGGVRLIGLDPERSVRGPRDPRPVVEGVDVAPMNGYGLLASACWGANDFDFTRSDDSVVLYACDASCRKVLDVAKVKGTFYAYAQLATSGQDGVVVYNREPKGPDGGEDQTVAQRFTCPSP